MVTIKALVDTNIILDDILHRAPFFENAKAIFDLSERRLIEGCISSSAVTDVFYIARKKLKDINLIYRIVDTLTNIFTVIPVFDSTIKNALALRWKDFEDAVQYMAAMEHNITHIITRNPSDYKDADITVISPDGFLDFVNKPPPD